MARLLARQDPEGTWAGGLYSPKWTSTTYTMLLLRDFGLPASSRQARKAWTLLLDRGLQRDGGINYGARAKWTRRSETCFTGMVLSILSHSEYDDERFYTLHRRRGVWAVRSAQRRGREFLLAHRLFRSHRAGQIIKPEFTRFSLPPRWLYDILCARDHFQAVNAPGDRRLTEAVEIVRGRQRGDGRWSLQHSYRGKTYFEFERPGVPSRWNTLRALRVLRWWGRYT